MTEPTNPPQGGQPGGKSVRAKDAPPQNQPESKAENKFEAEEGNKPADLTNTGFDQDASNKPEDQTQPGMVKGFVKSGQEQAPQMTSQGPSAGGVTTDTSTEQRNIEEKPKTNPQEGFAGRPLAAVQYGLPSDALQPNERQNIVWQEAHIGRAPEALQEALNREESSSQLSPATDFTATALDPSKPTTGKFQGPDLTVPEERVEEPPPVKEEDQEKPMTKTEEEDPRVKALETLPDQELRDLATRNKIRLAANWPRSTMIRKLREANVEVDQPKQDKK
jgi:hypothetical protein